MVLRLLQKVIQLLPMLQTKYTVPSTNPPIDQTSHTGPPIDLTINTSPLFNAKKYSVPSNDPTRHACPSISHSVLH